MAAPPVKSRPLHNFPLPPHLKWARKNPSPASEPTSHQQRFRRDFPDQNHHRRAGDHSDSHTKTGNHHKQPSTALPRDDVVLHEEGEEENGEGKPWNLRPRKEVTKVEPNPKRETAAENIDKKIISNSNVVKSQRRRGLVEGGQMSGGIERKEKSKLWISLSRREIEEDVYALTGGKPARRPRKWPKNVQKQLDVCV